MATRSPSASDGGDGCLTSEPVAELHPGSSSPTRAKSQRWSVNVKGIVPAPAQSLQASRVGVENTTAAVEVLHGVSKAVPVVETAEPR